MTAIRKDCLPMPTGMEGRPVDPRGFPVPWFATRMPDGSYDFRFPTVDRVVEAVRHDKCWVSGQRLGRFKAFVIGPMCTINRVSGDPPVRRDIALWSARVCPFLSRPLARRNERGRDEIIGDMDATPDIMLERNPGLCAVWVTRSYELMHMRGLMFRLGQPSEVLWFTEGRPATRAEVMAAIERGLPTLMDMAKDDGEGAVNQLIAQHNHVQEHYLPEAA